MALSGKASQLKNVFDKTAPPGLAEKGGRALRGRKSGAEQAADEEALASMQLTAICETVFLAAAADNELTDEEYDQLGQTVADVFEGHLDAATLDDIIEGFSEALERDGFEGRINAVAGVLADQDLRRAALALATGMAYIDGEVSEDEEDVFDAIATAFGFDDDEVDQIVEFVQSEMGVTVG